MGFKRMIGTPKKLEEYLETEKEIIDIIVTYLPLNDQLFLINVYGKNFSKKLPYAGEIGMKRLHASILPKLRRLLVKYQNNALNESRRQFVVIDNPDALKEDTVMNKNLEESKKEEDIIPMTDLQDYHVILKHLLRPENVKETFKKLKEEELSAYEMMIIVMATKRYDGKLLSFKEIAEILKVSEDEVWQTFVKGLKILSGEQLAEEKGASEELGVAMRFVYRPEVNK